MNSDIYKITESTNSNFLSHSDTYTWEIMNAPSVRVEKSGYIFYGFDCRKAQMIYYNNLPDWFLAYDAWDTRKKKLLRYQDFLSVCQDNNVHICKMLIRVQGSLPSTDYYRQRSDFGRYERYGLLIKNTELKLYYPIINPNYKKNGLYYTKPSNMDNKTNRKPTNMIDFILK